MRNALGIAAAAALVASISTASASADPSIWEKARHPLTKYTAAALKRAEFMLDQAEQAQGDPGLERSFLLNMVGISELFGDRKLSDPRLQLLIAQALYHAGVGREKEVRELLEAALSDGLDPHRAAIGWSSLGEVCQKLRDMPCALRAYSRALEITWEPDERSRLYGNRGDVKMALGNLDGAMADFQHAVRLATRELSQSVAYFGLAVALERRGDMPAALRAVSIADAVRIPVQFGPGISALDAPGIFFDPEYEIHYYKALAHMAAAQRASEPREQRRHYDLAIERWSRYLEDAEPDGERWVPNARAHRSRCERAAQLLPEIEASEIDL